MSNAKATINNNGLTYTKTGDWVGLSKTLKELSKNLFIRCEVLMDKNGKLVEDSMRQHIERQDLPWAPISETSLRMGASETIYVETGFLRDNLLAKKVTSTKHQVTFFVGASSKTTHQPSGDRLVNIMMMMEYGTSKQPPRPLIRPTWEELLPLIKNEWLELIDDLISGRV